MQGVTVIGGGLAGSEAAWQLAIRGIPVRLVEMRPARRSPAHHTDMLAELVCSNSLKSDDPSTAAGLLKREMAALNSMVVDVARSTAVPAGAALAVDREAFARRITDLLSSHPLIQVVREEATALPDGDVIVCTGPLTSDGLEPALSALTGEDRLAFYDAAAPIVDAATIDRRHVFAASRWGKGEGADYLNCPLSQADYERLVAALVGAQRVHAHAFEKRDLFCACQPIEEIARSGADALRFGALKPVGLSDPVTGERPYAVVQLRAENQSGTAYNLVGFQTNLTFAEQKRVFRAIPGLENAEFLRYGVMHRNTYVDAPRLLTPGLALRAHPRVRVAGQLAGTEGYLEAAAGGLIAALDVVAARRGMALEPLPQETVLGALLAYATNPATIDYQPMHVNFGLVPPLPGKPSPKRVRYERYAARATQSAADFVACNAALLEGGANVRPTVASVAAAEVVTP